MPNYRILGYYDDNGQVYDGTWGGEDSFSAVIACKSSLLPSEINTLCLVAILDDVGRNVYEGDKASWITDWEEDE